MSYTLIISEKPTAAMKIAEALSTGELEKLGKKDAPYYKISRKGKDIIVVPAVGHLFVLDEKEKGVKWKYPVFSVEWRPTFERKNNFWSKKYFQNINELVKGADEFVSACDYDIEGSVIAWNILRFICKVKDGKRMKFSTLTASDIVDAYENTSPHLDFPQIEAGLTRHHMDWYFGINMSRALTLSVEHVGGFWTLSTGRVQGPTLNILNERQKNINAFKPVPFWQLELYGVLAGKNIIANHEKDKFWKKEEMEKALDNSKGKEGIVKNTEKKEYKQHTPFPFDLTSLQRESYNRFGYSPKQTLDMAQGLYEHALISYPRTSSQKLPAKIGHREILKKLAGQKKYEELCERLLKNKSLKPNEGKKVDSAHPAIFPTGNKPKKISRYQMNIYDLIVKRFLSVFADAAIREQVRIEIVVGNETFLAHGVRTIKANWIDFYKPYAVFKEEILPEVSKGDKVKIEKIDMLDKKTEPPNRYSQASILKEMESLGLGTKATRAGILQTLYDRGYIREKSMHVTELGEAVINALGKYCPEIVSSELTKKFEADMEMVESGRKKKEEILKNVEKELGGILSNFKEHEKQIGEEMIKAIREYEREIHTVGKCGKCGGDLKIIHSHRTGKRFVGCSKYPKCTNSFPLPQHGFLEVISRPCPQCGLHIIQVKVKGKRSWRFCIKCGFENKIRKAIAEKKSGEKKPEENEGKKKEEKMVVKKPIKKGTRKVVKKPRE
jgi:DNA topoisomerase-1